MAVLKAKNLPIDSGRNKLVFLSKDCDLVKNEGFEGRTLVKIFSGEKYAIATLNLVDSSLVANSEMGLNSALAQALNAKNGDEFEIKHADPLTSFSHVRNKINGKPFTEEGIFEVIKDIADKKYTDEHMAAFCAATAGNRLSKEEIAYLTKAMVNTGDTIKWDYDIVVDKHCIGGIPGNRTTPLAIPIIAEYGLHIPKTSSRAITSPSGTADTMEVITNVAVPMEKMKEIVDKVNGCLVWGGSVSLSPSDDIIIKVKRDLDIDGRGQMLASIVSKKIAAGSTHILIDVPYGPSAKVKTLEDAQSLKEDFEELGKLLGSHIYVNISDGSQPVGNGVGPALECKDMIDVLQNKPNAPQDLKEKTIQLSGIILEFSPDVKAGEGAKIAREILESGRAWERFKMICEAQGGMKEIPTAKFTYDVLADKDGTVAEFDNRKLSYMAKLAGAPESQAAGVYLWHHLGDAVKKGDKLFTIHSDSEGELKLALDLTKEFTIVKVK